MKKILGTLMLTCALATSTAVFAQSGDRMKQDADPPKPASMKQDSMKNDQMKKEKKPKKAAKKDQMKKDDAMQHDDRKHDDMKKDETKKRRDEAELAALRRFRGAGHMPAPVIFTHNSL
jgi:pentapeptide MXKDX repeat protein